MIHINFYTNGSGMRKSMGYKKLGKEEKLIQSRISMSHYGICEIRLNATDGGVKER